MSVDSKLRASQLIALCAALLMPVVPALAADDASALYEKALSASRNKEASTAVIHLKNAIQKDPSYLAAYVLLGEVYLDASDPVSAEKELLRAEQLGADKALTSVPLGKAYLAQDKFDQVIQNIQARGYSPAKTSEIEVLRGHAYMQLKQLDRAQEAFDAAARADQGNVLAIVGRATVLLRRGDIPNATKEAVKATDIAPSNAESWHVKASIEHATGRLAEALSDYNRAIEREPKHLAARVARAGVLMDLGKTEAAIQDVEFLRKESPLDPRAIYLQAVLQAQTGKDEASRKTLAEAQGIIQKLRPEFVEKHAPTLLLAGLVNYSQGNREKALTYLSKYVTQNPGQIGARRLLGSLLVEKGDAREAIRILDPVLRAAPNDYRLLTLMGTAHMKARMHVQAADYFDRAANISHDAPEVTVQRALNKLGAGHDDDAVTELATAFERKGNAESAGVLLVTLHLKQGNYSAAAKVAEKLHKSEPGNLTAHNLLAAAQLSAGNLKDARANYEQILAKNPSFLTAIINLAKLDTMQGNPPAAKQRLEALLKQDAKNVHALTELGRVAWAQNQANEAASWFEKARALDNRFVPALLALVDLNLALNKPQDALKVAQQAETAAPDNPQVAMAVGRAYIAINRKNEARAILTRVSTNAGSQTKLLFELARLQVAADDTTGATWSLRKAIDGDPKFVPAYIGLFEVENGLGNREAAVEALTKFHSRHPNNPAVARLQGDLYMSDRQFAKAIESYRAAASGKDGALAAQRLFQAYWANGEGSQAIQWQASWVKDHPKDVDARTALAEGYMRLGDYAKAKNHYEAIAQIRPNDATILNNLANAYAKLGDERALQVAEQAIKLAPNNPLAADTYGWLLVKNGQAEKALPHLRNAHSRASNDPEIRYHIGAALAKLGRNDEAVAELELALKGNARFEGADDARALVRNLKK